MATTYVPIATQTLGSNTATVTFSSIPSTYTDLVLIAVVKNSSTLNNGRFFFNNDTSSLYSGTYLQGNGSAASSGRVSNVNSCYTPEISTTDWTIITANIMNYSNTTTFKTTLIRGGTASDRTAAWVDLYRSTNAISRIDFETFGGNLLAGSTFSLYGIANAGIAGGAKATGGDIVTTDGTYWYHAFRNSGTFTPSVALTADVLVVAGGGGGGGQPDSGNSSGGGGAGGYLYFASQSVSTSALTVTVGAGGAGGPAGSNNGSQGSNSQFGALTASVGGGFGQRAFDTALGGTGGSGGGSSGSATSGQGNSGGTSVGAGSNYQGGGGGGAGAAGSGAGNGGAGLNTLSSWFSVTGTGVSGYVAGGGGGGQYFFTDGTRLGGAGGGGNGGGWNGSTLVAPVAGTVNTGGGGGGAGSRDGQGAKAGAAGGSGLVIVRYAV